jgi:uncharacterized protein (DUF58 family)
MRRPHSSANAAHRNPNAALKTSHHEYELPPDRLDERQFVIAVKRLANTLSYGTDRSPFLGSGIEYVQSRLYQFGDPIKAIDWRVTARTGKVFIKEYEAPKRMPVYLVVDTSASMTVSSQPLSKFAWAVQIAGGIAFACIERVSPVGVLGAGGLELHVRPSLSRDQVMQWLTRLRRHRIDEPTTLAQRLAELGPSLAHRVMVIVLSDLHDESAVPALRLLAQRHECIALQLRDPAESPVRRTGFFRASEAETGRTFLSQGQDWLDQARTGKALRRAGVDHLTLETNAPIAARLRNFLLARGVLGRKAR